MERSNVEEEDEIEDWNSLDLDSDGFSLDFYLLMIKLNNKLEKCM